MRTTYIVTLETRDETEPDCLDEHDVADALRDFEGLPSDCVTVVRLVRGSTTERAAHNVKHDVAGVA